MKCPVCDVYLKNAEYLGWKYTCCPQCDGIWVGAAEFDRILERAEAHEGVDWDHDELKPVLHRFQGEDEFDMAPSKLGQVLQHSGADVWEWDPHDGK